MMSEPAQKCGNNDIFKTLYLSIALEMVFHRSFAQEEIQIFQISSKKVLQHQLLGAIHLLRLIPQSAVPLVRSRDSIRLPVQISFPISLLKPISQPPGQMKCFFKNGPNPASFSFIFVLFTMQGQIQQKFYYK